jgi:flagellar basal body rod protein FlgB
LTSNEARECISINNMLYSEPLSDSELESIVRGDDTIAQSMNNINVEKERTKKDKFDINYEINKILLTNE